MRYMYISHNLRYHICLYTSICVHTYICVCVFVCGPPLVAQMVKNTPAMQETQVGSLGWEDPTEKGMAIHSSILA